MIVFHQSLSQNKFYLKKILYYSLLKNYVIIKAIKTTYQSKYFPTPATRVHFPIYSKILHKVISRKEHEFSSHFGF